MTLAPPVDNASVQASWFAPQSFMNSRIGALRRVDSQSAGVVAKLAGWVHGRPASLGPKYGLFTPASPWINATTNVYPADYARRQNVTLKVTWWLQTAQQPYLASVPVPDVAVGNATPDRSVVIVDEAKGTIWEFWKFTRDPTTGALSASAAGWIASHRVKEGVYTTMSSAPQSAILAGAAWGVQASGFSQLAGLTTVAEIIQGCIPHATAGVVPWARAPWFSPPAQRTDGHDETVSGIPYGARFMLDPGFDPAAYEQKRREAGWEDATPESAFRLGRFARIVINAWKAFGFVPVDQTTTGVALLMESAPSCVARTGGACGPFYGPDGAPGGPDDLYDQPPDDIMRQLPWEELKMMPTILHRTP